MIGSARASTGGERGQATAGARGGCRVRGTAGAPRARAAITGAPGTAGAASAGTTRTATGATAAGAPGSGPAGLCFGTSRTAAGATPTLTATGFAAVASTATIAAACAGASTATGATNRAATPAGLLDRGAVRDLTEHALTGSQAMQHLAAGAHCGMDLRADLRRAHQGGHVAALLRGLHGDDGAGLTGAGGAARAVQVLSLIHI